MKHIVAVLVVFSIVGCSTNNKNYQIIKDVDRNGLGELRDVEVLLNQKITIRELEKIGGSVLNKKAGFDRTWIYYFLEGEPERAWASTHANPELEVLILGSTIVQDSLMIENIVNHAPGEMVSVWKAGSDLMGTHYVLSKSNNQLLFSSFFKDGSQLTDTISFDGDKFDMGSGEFGVIEDDGNLSFHSYEDGLFAKLKHVEKL